MSRPAAEASFTIREAVPADAEQLLTLIKLITEEPGVDIPIGPGEFHETVEDERRILEEYRAAENSVYLVADAGGQVIGSLSCKGGSRRASRHSVMLGLLVRKDWRNRGVGTELLLHAIDWAHSNGIVTRIELGVYARNKTAIHLYEKVGFEHEGRKRRALFQDGEFVDDLVMALLL